MGNKGSWWIFILLCLIWGSSFMLMRQALMVLQPLHVASIRILSSAIVLMPLLLRALRRIPIGRYRDVGISGLLGNLLPAYLFCFAQTKVESSMAGCLNALTPIFMLVTGTLFFNHQNSTSKVLGIFISFFGTIFLYASHHGISWDASAGYNFLIVLATLSYGLNINFVNRHLKGLESFDLATLGLFLVSIPCWIVLMNTGFFQLDFQQPAIRKAIGFTLLLGISSTALASVLYYMLIKRSGPVLSSLVTYGIPVVAIMWGLLFGEQIEGLQIIGLGMILGGVFMVSRAR